jgi:2-C-methyl-D-erythritol 2,4-cyclodiphosphate synthase
MRIGFGYDSHRLVDGRRLVLGGVEVPHEKGLLGHSDGDALLHAIIDSIIGALGLGDIGGHFPDTDPKYRDASSSGLLREVVELASEEGYEVTWVDSTVVMEEPRLAPFIAAMKETVLKAGVKGVNIKAKSNERMGPIGRGEGAAAYAVCLLGPVEG